jgi:hypothetical protein
MIAMLSAGLRARGSLRPPTLHANMGGPMSRARTERIRSTLLGRDDGPIRCPRVLRAGLRFRKGADPVHVMQRLLARAGFDSPEALRAVFDLPAAPLICQPLPTDAPRLEVLISSPEPLPILEQALLLGLSTAYCFDPARPVLWTQASLTRGIALFDPAGFYA